MKTATANAAAKATATDKSIKRVISLSLILALCLSFSACSGAKENELQEQEEAPAPRYSFESSSAEIGAPDYNLSPLFYSGSGFYAFGMEKTGENIPEEVVKAAEKEGEDPVNDGRYNVYEPRLCFINSSGETERLPAYEPLPSSEGESTGIDALCLNSKGEICLLEHIFSSGKNEEEENIFERRFYLRVLGEKGEELSKTEIGKGLELTGAGRELFCLEDGNFVFLAEIGEERAVVTLSENGELISLEKCSENASKLILLSTGELEAREADCFSGALGYLFLVSDSSGLYGCNEAGEREKLFSWSSINVFPRSICSEIYGDEAALCFMLSGGEIISLKAVPYDEGLEKTVLTLAVSDPDQELTAAVAEFNRSSRECRIEFVEPEYSSDSPLPDILDVSELSYASMAADGLLEDLYPFIDSDREISREDYFENILAACETGGKLCFVCAGFTVNTVLGESSLFGDEPGLSFEEYYEALGSMPEGGRALELFATQSSVLQSMLELEISGFVDFETGECSFDCAEFEELLEFCASFPEYFDYEHHGWSESDSTDLSIKNGTQMLLPLTIYGFEDALYAGFEFDAPVTFVGYPVASGTGNSITPMTCSSGCLLAMSSSCSNKEEAWSFLRSFLEKESQRKLEVFPSNMEVFNEKLEEAMEFEYILDRKGNPLIDSETGEKRIYALGTMYLSDYTPVKYYPLSEERAEKLEKLVTTTTRRAYLDEDIFRIIKNCAEPYFRGEISASAAAVELQAASSKLQGDGGNEELQAAKAAQAPQLQATETVEEIVEEPVEKPVEEEEPEEEEPEEALEEEPQAVGFSLEPTAVPN